MFAVLTAPSRLTCVGGGGEGHMCTLMCMYEWARVSVSVCLCVCDFVCVSACVCMWINAKKPEAV